MPLGDILKGLAGEAVKSTVRGTFREHKNYADYEKEIAAKMASDDASHSAKEGGLTVDEAEDLIEKSRDSAVAEAQKRTKPRTTQDGTSPPSWLDCLRYFGGARTLTTNN